MKKTITLNLQKVNLSVVFQKLGNKEWYEMWQNYVPIFEDYDFLPNQPAHGWDGNFRGVALNPAVFVYVAEVAFIDGEVRIFAGDVTLIR